MLRKNSSHPHQAMNPSIAPQWEKYKIFTIKKGKQAITNLVGGDIWNSHISLEEMFGNLITQFHLEGAQVTQEENSFFKVFFLLILACYIHEDRGLIFFPDDFEGGWFEKQVKEAWSTLKEAEKDFIWFALEGRYQNILHEILGVIPSPHQVTQATKVKVSNLH